MREWKGSISWAWGGPEWSISEDQIYDGLEFIGASYKKYIEFFNHCYEKYYPKNLKNAPILILDEAMAAVDSENERLIGEAIDGLSKDKTVITIAHHLNTIRDSDQIIVMDKGVVLDAGSHEELMKRCDFYKDMVEAQNKVDSWNLKEVVTENV